MNVKRLMIVAAIAMTQAFAQTGDNYKVIKTVKVGGEGGFDYVYADSDGRKLYVPRNGPNKRISVYDLDTLALVTEIPNTGGQGVAVDPKSHHGFATSRPVVMWDTTTLKPIKTIDVQGGPDGILFEPSSQRVYILSHSAPNVTVIDSKDGSIVGTIDLGGAPEQSASDGNGHLYVDLEDKGAVAVVDTKAMKVTNTYSLGDNKGAAGLAFDAEAGILFVECREPAVSVIMSAKDGHIITTLPIGAGVDGAGFISSSKEAVSSQRDGTLTVIKETSPTSFAVAQTVQTIPSAKTMTIDTKTNHMYLIGAEFGPAPAADPASPSKYPRRGPMIPGSFTIVEVGK